MSRCIINLNDTAILNMHVADYHSIIGGISKSDVINLLKNADLTSPYIKWVKKL